MKEFSYRSQIPAQVKLGKTQIHANGRALPHIPHASSPISESI
jgi:hypothetical protein